MNTMENDLTPNSQPQTSYAGFPRSLFREPCSGNWYVDQRRTGWDAMFTFSGKERDQETGYGYFGARYYDSDISIWLSVDPLADKYPHQSNYVYCGNNPLKIIDPDGREEWDLAKDGSMTMRENGRKDIDIVYGIDADGKELSETFKKETIKPMSEGNGTVDYGGERGKENVTYQYLDIEGDGDATRFFELAAKTTDIEWAHIQTGENDNRIGTAGYKLEDPTGSLIVTDFLNQGVNVRKDVHSHPYNNNMIGYPKVSDGDRNWAGYLDRRCNGNPPPTQVYQNSKNGWQYVSYSKP